MSSGEARPQHEHQPGEEDQCGHEKDKLQHLPGSGGSEEKIPR